MSQDLLLTFVFNVLLGVAMYFLKVNNDTLRDRIKKNEEELTKLRDDSLRWRDFASFKEELWGRLDNMERRNS